MSVFWQQVFSRAKNIKEDAGVKRKWRLRIQILQLILYILILVHCAFEKQGRCTLHKHWGVFGAVIPVGVGCGQHELELYYTCVVLQLTMLDAVQLICDVGSANVHLHKLKILPQILHPIYRLSSQTGDLGMEISVNLTSSAAILTTWLLW